MMFVGAVHALHAACGVEVFGCLKGVAGTSAGALMSVLLVAGYSPSELVCLAEDGGEFHSLTPDMNVGALRDSFGLDDGERLERTVGELLVAKGFSAMVSLSQFQQLTKKKFVCVATAVEEGKPVYLESESWPDLPVCKAVRMSMSIPGIYAQCSWDGILYADGGITDNLPLGVFPREESVCLRIARSQWKLDGAPWWGYLSCLIDTTFQQQEKEKLSHSGFPSERLLELHCGSAPVQVSPSYKFGAGVQFRRKLVAWGAAVTWCELCASFSESIGIFVKLHAIAQDERLWESKINGCSELG